MGLRLKCWKVKILFQFLFFFILASDVKAKVTFEKAELQLGGKILPIELAVSREQLSYGLMNRTLLPENYGMLFIFDKEEPRSFWMKNTFVDLSIGFFDKNKKLVDIQDMKAVKSVMEETESYFSKHPAMYALEVPSGWFKKNKINLGEIFKFSKTVAPKNLKNKGQNQ